MFALVSMFGRTPHKPTPLGAEHDLYFKIVPLKYTIAGVFKEFSVIDKGVSTATSVAMVDEVHVVPAISSAWKNVRLVVPPARSPVATLGNPNPFNEATIPTVDSPPGGEYTICADHVPAFPFDVEDALYVILKFPLTCLNNPGYPASFTSNLEILRFSVANVMIELEVHIPLPSCDEQLANWMLIPPVDTL
jgi:hypothetical protein